MYTTFSRPSSRASRWLRPISASLPRSRILRGGAQEEIGALVRAHAGVRAEDEVRGREAELREVRGVLRHRPPEFHVDAVRDHPRVRQLERTVGPRDVAGAMPDVD